MFMTHEYPKLPVQQGLLACIPQTTTEPRSMNSGSQGKQPDKKNVECIHIL